MPTLGTKAYPLANVAAAELARRSGVDRHDVVVVLGSGWSGAADTLGPVTVEFPVTELPGFLAPVADGHAGLVRSSACHGVLVPLLGLIFLPWTTLLYTLAYAPVGGVSGIGWVVVAFGVAADIGSYTSGAYQRGRRSAG